MGSLHRGQKGMYVGRTALGRNGLSSLTRGTALFPHCGQTTLEILPRTFSSSEVRISSSSSIAFSTMSSGSVFKCFDIRGT